MEYALLGLGLVFVVEGLVWALAPGLVEQMLAVLATLPEGARRMMGLVALALGVALVWWARALGA